MELIAILLWAFNVNSLPDVHAKALLTTIFPSSEPSFEVITVTLLLASAAAKVSAFITLPCQFAGVSPEPATISILVGSINQLPVAPLGARVSICALSTFSCAPDVSIWPPTPKTEPPRASSFPLTSVIDKGLLMSLHATTRPPSPFEPADAVTSTS